MNRGPTCIVCNAPATQRLVRPGVFVSHRCTKHKFTKAAARSVGLQIFDITKETVR